VIHATTTAHEFTNARKKEKNNTVKRKEKPKAAIYKMLNYRRETALQNALQFSPKVEDWNWETIFHGQYRSIFNHSDIIGRKIGRIP